MTRRGSRHYSRSGNTARGSRRRERVATAACNDPAAAGLRAVGPEGWGDASTAASDSAAALLTLTVSVPASVTLAAGQGLARVTAAGGEVSAPAARLTLTGTAAELNAILRGGAGADRIRYSGPATVSLVFSITEDAASSIDGAPVGSTVTTVVQTVTTAVTADPAALETGTALAALPTTLWVTPGQASDLRFTGALLSGALPALIHISEPTRLRRRSYAVFCWKKKNRYTRL